MYWRDPWRSTARYEWHLFHSNCGIVSNNMVVTCGVIQTVMMNVNSHGWYGMCLPVIIKFFHVWKGCYLISITNRCLGTPVVSNVQPVEIICKIPCSDFVINWILCIYYRLKFLLWYCQVMMWEIISGLLGYDTVWSAVWVSTFWRSILG